MSTWQEDIAAMGATPPPASCWLADFNATDYALGDRQTETPSLLHRRDMNALLYEGHVNEIHGEPEGGKGFVAAVPCAEVIRDGGVVLYLDFDQDPESVTERVLAAGAKPDMLERLKVRAIDEPLPMVKTNAGRELLPAGAEIMAALCGIEGLRLIVIDGVNNALAMHGLDPNSMTDYADFNRLVSMRFRNAGERVTVLLMDHVTKDRDVRNRWAIGSQQKMTVLDGACYEVQVVEQPAPGRLGTLRLIVRKDRRGGVRSISTRVKARSGSFDIAADVDIDSRADATTIEVKAPPADAGPWRPTFLMERVSMYLEGRDDSPSQTDIERDVEGNAERIREAIAGLVESGHVRREKRGKAWRHESVKPYRQPTGEDI